MWPDGTPQPNLTLEIISTGPISTISVPAPLGYGRGARQFNITGELVDLAIRREGRDEVVLTIAHNGRLFLSLATPHTQYVHSLNLEPMIPWDQKPARKPPRRKKVKA